MARQWSVSVRNARADAVESTIGTSAILEMFTGSPPANCAAADSGTKIVSINLPSDWLAAAASGAKAKSGTWQGTAIATGTPGHYRIKDSGGTTVHEQGTVTFTGGGGDITVDASGSVTSGQTVTVATFAWTEPNS